MISSSRSGCGYGQPSGNTHSRSYVAYVDGVDGEYISAHSHAQCGTFSESRGHLAFSSLFISWVPFFLCANSYDASWVVGGTSLACRTLFQVGNTRQEGKPLAVNGFPPF
ncbi:hypothetical protein D2F01_01725 [Mycobacteroides abscessus]|nr:hypothetical protein D2F01_01725 [Mycobacteroides abscessus]